MKKAIVFSAPVTKNFTSNLHHSPSQTLSVFLLPVLRHLMADVNMRRKERQVCKCIGRASNSVGSPLDQVHSIAVCASPHSWNTTRQRALVMWRDAPSQLLPNSCYPVA